MLSLTPSQVLSRCRERVYYESMADRNMNGAAVPGLTELATSHQADPMWKRTHYTAWGQVNSSEGGSPANWVQRFGVGHYRGFEAGGAEHSADGDAHKQMSWWSQLWASLAHLSSYRLQVSTKTTRRSEPLDSVAKE